MGTFWSPHSHSKYSAKDALPTVEQIVVRASELGYPALGLTDHGTLAGSVALYTGCRKAGIEPLPGLEAYVALDRTKGKRPQTFHLGMLATTEQGYRNLVALNNTAQANFRWKPVLDLGDLAAASENGALEGIAALSGCWFGMLPSLLREGDVMSTRNVLLSLDSWFGAGLFVEIQHHRISDEEHDDDAHVAILSGIANELGLPMVLTQDSHYVHSSDRFAHDTLKRLMSWSDDPDDALFPGDGYHMVDASWMVSRYTPEILSAGLAGLEHLAGMAKVVIPELDHFKVALPGRAGDPDTELLAKALAGLDARMAAGTITAESEPVHLERIETEAEVVRSSGMAAYLLMAADVCAFMRSMGIAFNVRGSAAGSHLCWLLEITSFDTLHWGLPFDRFLSADRQKMPDIDIDVEHRRRSEVIAFLRSRYHVVHISTWIQLKIEGDAETNKGSLLVRWKMQQRKTGGNPNRRLSSEEYSELNLLDSHKTYGGFGVHPAGLLVTPDEATAAIVPLQWVASSKTMVTAFDKDDIEKLGLVKLDVLGLRTLTAMKIVTDQLGLGDWRNVPLADHDTFELIRSGRTTGLFQLEGGASARGVRQLQPRTIGDVVAAMALFRPAALEAGATESYIDRRRGKAKMPVQHPIIMAATKDTYGVLLYQEQAIGIMKSLGLSVEEVEAGRKAIKASNAGVGDAREVLARLRVKIRKSAEAAGFSEVDADYLDAALDAYAGYSFNLAHATSYGLLSYATAYFRTHHPLEFWTGMLVAYDDSPIEVWYGKYPERLKVKQPVAYRREAQADGVRLLGPHVNHSGHSWVLDTELRAIRAGLGIVHGIGPVATTELVRHAPYANLDDLAMRVSSKRVTGSKDLGAGHSPSACGGAIAALHKAGALTGLTHTPKETT